MNIVHLGPGAFFRAFGVPWLQDVAAATGEDITVTGVSLRSAGVRDSLAARDFDYHALERGPDGNVVRDVQGLANILVAPEDPMAVIEAMADASVNLVTLTVTEKGYCYSAAKEGLDLGNPGIVHELANPELPETAPGFIVAALAQRRAQGLRPFTCLSCDNLPENGRVLRAVVLDLARRIDPGLAEWIAVEARFPCSMVDRIVPATTSADLDAVEQLTELRDGGVVAHEPFRQWVIEDDFVDRARPAFEAAGVQMVTDVAPYEHMKLRCLNGTHSAIAYLGVLAGIESVSQAMAEPRFAAFIRAMWGQEIVPSFAAPVGVDVAAYTDALMARYCNRGIEHRTQQIAMDGSQKLPQRIVAVMADNLDAGRSVDRLGVVIAAWVHFLQGAHGEVNDPLVGLLQPFSRSDDPVGKILNVQEVFDAELVTDARFAAAVRDGYQRLSDANICHVLEELT